MISQTAPHNSDVRIPQDTREWPLDILLDMSYAAAVLHAWGSKDFLDHVRSETKDIYYPRLNDQEATHTARLRARIAKKGQERQETFDTFDVVYALWTQSAGEYSQQHTRDIEAAESARSRGRVEEWLQSIE